jgi:hypothetical protein
LTAFSSSIPFSASWPFISRDSVYIFMLFEKVGHVEEGIPLQSQIHKSALHPGKHPGHAAFVNTPCKRILVGTLEIHLDQLIVF